MFRDLQGREVIILRGLEKQLFILQQIGLEKI